MSPPAPLWQTFRNWLFGSATGELPAQPGADATKIAERVTNKLNGEKPKPGRTLLSFPHRNYQLRLDADVTQTFRLTAHQQSERVFAFLIHTDDAESEAFRDSLRQIFAYLTDRPSLKELPKTDQITGNFFGWPE